MPTMNQQQEKSKHAETIIRNHVLWSMGASFIPVVLADIAAISALQLDMIRQMCKVYDQDFNETRGKAIVSSLTGTALARASGKAVARSLVKMIPGVGSVIGGISLSIFAGANTYALGQVFKTHFEAGGTILDFDADRLKKKYTEWFEKGKKVATDWKKEEKEGAPAASGGFTVPGETKSQESTPATNPVTEAPNDAIARIRELHQLLQAGAISQEEYDAMKKKLIEEM